jgi:hypothetical protein
LIDEDEGVVVDGCAAAGVDGVMSGMYEKEERKTRTAREKENKGSERDDAAWVVMEDGKVSGGRTISSLGNLGQIPLRRLLSHWEDLTTYLEREARRALMAGACDGIWRSNHQDAWIFMPVGQGRYPAIPAESRRCRSGMHAQRSALRYAHTH